MSKKPLEEVFLESYEVPSCSSLLESMKKFDVSAASLKKLYVLQEEGEILRKIRYKHKSQHRRSKHFHRMEAVLRHLKWLDEMNLVELMKQVGQILVLPLQETKAKKWSHDNRPLLPVSRTGDLILRKLRAASILLHRMHLDCLKTTRYFNEELSDSFFMALALTVVSLMSRISILAMHHMANVCTMYNFMAEIRPWMPSTKTELPEEIEERLRRCTTAQGTLPGRIHCQWTNGLAILNEEGILSSASALVDSRQAKFLGKRMQGSNHAGVEDIGYKMEREPNWDVEDEDVVFLVEDREGNVDEPHESIDHHLHARSISMVGSIHASGSILDVSGSKDVPTNQNPTVSKIDAMGSKFDLDAWLGTDRKKKKKEKREGFMEERKERNESHDKDRLFRMLWN